MKFIVDRTKWYRGQGQWESKLLRNDGMRCCIGFVGQQVGVADHFLNCGTVNMTHGPKDIWPKWMKDTAENADIYRAYRTNDNNMIDDTTRESQLQAIFSRNGDEIEFVG